MIVSILGAAFLFILAGIYFCLFFDHAVLTRQGTIFHVSTLGKKVALTFDDGPSPIWTPRILDILKKEEAKATFFMIGHHVQQYPDVARCVAREGHLIGNHGYAHSVLLYYTLAEIEEEIKYTEIVIKNITGCTTQFYRPPKAWMTTSIKRKIKSMGYDIVLWSLNSKDWVSFNHRHIVKYFQSKIRSGDILLFHDSGNVFSREGGDRTQMVKAVSLLIHNLKHQGFQFVTVEELIHG